MKKSIFIILSGLLVLSISSAVLAETVKSYVVWGTTQNEVNENKIDLSTSDPFEFTQYSAIITDRTLIMDGVKGTPILKEDIMPNQSLYVYPDYQYEGFTPNALAIVANIPQDFGAPLFATIENISINNDGTALLKTKEHENAFKITKETCFEKFTPIGSASIDSIPTVDELKPGMKVFIDLGNNGELKKCYLTPMKISEPKKTESFTLYVEGIEEKTDLYLANSEIYLPLRLLADIYGYEIKWDSENEAASVKIDDKNITLPVNSEHYLIDGTLYAPESFFENIFNLNIEIKPDTIYVSEK